MPTRSAAHIDELDAAPELAPRTAPQGGALIAGSEPNANGGYGVAVVNGQHCFGAAVAG
jgi:hypothetical protein